MVLFLSFCTLICLISPLKLKRKQSRKEKRSGHTSWQSVTMSTGVTQEGRWDFDYIHCLHALQCSDIILGLCRGLVKTPHRFQLSTAHTFP